VVLDADGAAPEGDCYDVATGLKVFIGMAALVPQNSSEPVVISPVSTLVGIGAIIGVPEAVRHRAMHWSRGSSCTSLPHANTLLCAQQLNSEAAGLMLAEMVLDITPVAPHMRCVQHHAYVEICHIPLHD
jgi:hypothetical protein